MAGTDLTPYMVAGDIQALQPGEYGLVMGRLLARYLGVAMGDSLTLTLPQLTITPAGVFPRLKRFRLVGVFEVGAQVDQNLVLIHVGDARKLYRLGSAVHGVELKTVDMYQAAAIVSAAAGPWGERVDAVDWSQTQGSLFAAVKMEKTVITVLLLIIVAVAAFNIVSGLVLMVADKRMDIAVLRTLGLTRRQIMLVFITQGGAIGSMGVVLGAVLGSVIAFWVGDLVAWLEQLSGIQVFDPNVYFISQLPSQWQWQDVALVCSVGLLLSFLSTLYPAYRASLIEPAEALRYE
jgi:lipoprotein-releasing system permease protein